MPLSCSLSGPLESFKAARLNCQHEKEAEMIPSAADVNMLHFLQFVTDTMLDHLNSELK